MRAERFWASGGKEWRVWQREKGGVVVEGVVYEVREDNWLLFWWVRRDHRGRWKNERAKAD